MGRGNASVLIMTMMIMSLCVSKGVIATNYKVGDGSWAIMSYDSWLSGKTFKVGDTLEFVYTNSHDVVEVNEAEYGSCSKGSNTVFTNGDTTYNLSAVGTRYFICSVSGHCAGGMKLAVPVEAASATTPTTSPTSPTSSTPSSTPTTPSNSTTTTPPSSSSRLSASSLFCSLLLTLGLSILFFKS